MRDNSKSLHIVLSPSNAAFDFVGETSQDSIQMAEPLDGSLLSRYRDVAREHSMYASALSHSLPAKVFGCPWAVSTRRLGASVASSFH